MPDLKFCVCGKIIKKADKYCEKCRKERTKKNTELKKRYDKNYDKYIRDEKKNTFYHSGAWAKLTNLIKTRDSGLCLLCWNNNMITRGRITHHIVPLDYNWSKRLDPLNCIYLCDKCHNKVHKEYDKDKQSRELMQQKLKKLVFKHRGYT